MRRGDRSTALTLIVDIVLTLMGGIVGAWGGLFGVLYLRRRAFVLGKWQFIAPFLLMWAIFVSGSLALALQLQEPDTWWYFSWVMVILVISLCQSWNSFTKYDHHVYVISAADVLDAVHAVLQEKNLAFEDIGQEHVAIPVLQAEITLKYHNWGASSDIYFHFPPNRPEKEELVRQLKLALAGRKYGKFPGQGVTYLVLVAIWCAFLTTLYALFH